MLDKETNQEYVDGEELSNLVQSKGWHLAKRALFNNILLIDSVETIDTEDKSLEDIGKETFARAAAVKLILEWIREIEGSKQSHDQLRDSLKEKKEEGFIKRYPDQNRE